MNEPLELSVVDEGEPPLSSRDMQDLYDATLFHPDSEREGDSPDAGKISVCGPHEGYLQVTILAAQSDDVEVSVEEDPHQVVVDIR